MRGVYHLCPKLLKGTCVSGISYSFVSEVVDEDGIDELPQPIHSRNRVRKPSCRWPCGSRGRPMPAGPRAAPAAA